MVTFGVCDISKSRWATLSGAVLYTGTKSLSFGPRLKALPVSALWHL